MAEVTKVGKRGTVVIPAGLRKRFGLDEGQEVFIEETPDGLLLRPAVTLPVEIHSLERQAAFLLDNSIDASEAGQLRSATPRADFVGGNSSTTRSLVSWSRNED